MVLSWFHLGGQTQPLRGFVDADWAGDQDTRRSYTGYIFFVNLGIVNFKPQLLSLAPSRNTYEACWHRILFRSLQVEMPNATTIFGDNQGSLKLAQNPADHARTKHIDVRYHVIRDLVQRKVEKTLTWQQSRRIGSGTSLILHK